MFIIRVVVMFCNCVLNTGVVLCSYLFSEDTIVMTSVCVRNIFPYILDRIIGCLDL